MLEPTLDNRRTLGGRYKRFGWWQRTPVRLIAKLVLSSLAGLMLLPVLQGALGLDVGPQLLEGLRASTCGTTWRAKLTPNLSTFLCLRCASIVVGGAAGGWITSSRPIPYLLLSFGTALTLLALDVLTEQVGLRGPSPLLRLFTGGFLGWSAASLVFFLPPSAHSKRHSF